MITITTHKSKIAKVALLPLFLIALTNCGGGGSGGNDNSSSTASTSTPTTVTNNTNTTQPESYVPDPKKQQEVADDSADLYVEEDFEFNTYKTITLDVQAFGTDGEPLANVLMFFSAIPAQMTEKESELIAEKSLIGVFKMNENGAYYGQIEVAANVTNTMLQLNTLGIENEVILALPENNILQYQF